MKKRISLILSVIMIFSCVSLFMSNASAQAPTAPEIVGAQNTLPDSQGTQKIRFLAGVSSLDGKKIGFEITAQFTHDNEYRTVTYSGSEYESRYVYTAVTAVGADGNYEAVSAQDLGKSYLCAISLTAVPTVLAAKATRKFKIIL